MLKLCNIGSNGNKANNYTRWHIQEIKPYKCDECGKVFDEESKHTFISDENIYHVYNVLM